MNYFTISIVFCAILGFAEGKSRAAHHKVHNLALYPERHSWCQVTAIKQEIAAAQNSECTPTTIDNSVCVGACFSYSVPRVEEADAVIPPYCDACRVTRSSWTVISLNCTRAATGEHYYLPKNVELIQNCSCVDCNDNSPRGGGHDDDNDSSGDSEEEEIEDEIGVNAHVTGNNVNPDHFIKNTEDQDATEDEEDADADQQHQHMHKHKHHHHHYHSDPANHPDTQHTGTIHEIKSVSAESRGVSKDEEDLMIKKNKVSPDDDDDDEDTRQRLREKKREM